MLNQRSITGSALKLSVDGPSLPTFKKISNLGLYNLFCESGLTWFILEKICLTFAFVKGTINIISNIWRMFLHSSLMVSLVNTLDHITNYSSPVATYGFLKLSIRACCQLHNCFWIVILENEMIFLSQHYHQSYCYLYLLAKILSPVKLQYF